VSLFLQRLKEFQQTEHIRGWPQSGKADHTDWRDRDRECGFTQGGSRGGTMAIGAAPMTQEAAATVAAPTITDFNACHLMYFL
jgi:hypothetical protein